MTKQILQFLAILRVHYRHFLVLKIQQWVHLLLYKGTQISFCWVSAHAGVHGNEDADRLAKAAALDLLPRKCLLLYNDFFPSIRKFIINFCQEYWNSIGECKIKEITGVTFPWKYSSMPRSWETALCRFRIGHTRLTAF